MVAGAREGRLTGLRRLVAQAQARDLRAFVIPGPDAAGGLGLDIEAAGMSVASTPRDAGVLLLVGAFAGRLAESAAVVYAQMMRPRVILALGCRTADPLPAADVHADLSQEGLEAGVHEVRAALAGGAFAYRIADFDAPLLHVRIEYVCPMHPEVVSEEPGSCPKCGMSLVARDAGRSGEPTHAQEEHGHAGDEHADHGHGAHEHGGHGHTGHGQGDHGHDAHERAGHEHTTHAHHEHAHGHDGHDHGDSDFMSMVEVTRDLPRSADGLAMDWVEVAFGPFFPGLPGGLCLRLTLDGDGVAEGRARSLPRTDDPCVDAGVSPSEFVDRMAAITPLAPVAWRVLACRALEHAGGITVDDATTRARAGTLERERIISHLGWLVLLGRQIGFDAWMRHAAVLQRRALTAGPDELASMRPEFRKLVNRFERTPLVARRLEGIGVVADADATLRGPVARAAGHEEDLGSTDPAYTALEFAPASRTGGDALDRARVRFDEIVASIELVARCGVSTNAVEPACGNASGQGMAAVETPRGRAELSVTLEAGRAIAMTLDTPCSHHIGLVPGLVAGQELGDALVAVGSLDLSPWEVRS